MHSGRVLRVQEHSGLLRWVQVLPRVLHRTAHLSLPLLILQFASCLLLLILHLFLLHRILLQTALFLLHRIVRRSLLLRVRQYLLLLILQFASCLLHLTGHRSLLRVHLSVLLRVREHRSLLRVQEHSGLLLRWVQVLHRILLLIHHYASRLLRLTALLSVPPRLQVLPLRVLLGVPLRVHHSPLFPLTVLTLASHVPNRTLVWFLRLKPNSRQKVLKPYLKNSWTLQAPVPSLRNGRVYRRVPFESLLRVPPPLLSP